MSKLEMIYSRLRSIGDVSVDRALAAALPSADPAAVKLICLTLLERCRPEGTIALVTHFHQLPAQVQQRVVARAGDLYRPLREAAGKSRAGARANVLHIIQESRSARLAYLVTEQLRHSDADLRARAGDCLLDLAGWAATSAPDMSSLGGGEPPPCDAQTAAYLVAAVEESVLLYPVHGQPTVLLAMMRLSPRPMATAMRALSSPQSPAGVAAVALIRASSSGPAAVRRALLALLRVPSLVGPVLEALPAICATGGLRDVLDHWHLLLLPTVSTALGQVTQPQALTPPIEALPRWLLEPARGLAHWVAVLPQKPNERVARLEALSTLEDATARLAALRQLMTLSRSSTPAVEAIARFCHDADASIARIALRHLRRRRWPGLSRLLPHLVNSPHKAVGRQASRQLAPLAFGRFWAGWPKLDRNQRLAAGRALIKIDPLFHQHLSDRLLEPDAEARVRALSMVSQLNQGAFFEEALIQLVGDANDRVASAAVSALGGAQSDAAVAALEAALNHANSRVRANAVEALEKLRATRHVQRLLEMAEHDDNRPRANAIKALMAMRTQHAMSALSQMLQDNRPNQRTSALWLVETMGLLDLTRQVAEMSITDADSAVKARAARVIQYLIDQLRPDAGGQVRPDVARAG